MRSWGRNCPCATQLALTGKEQFYCPHIKQQSHGQYAEKRLGPARNYLSSIAVGSGASQLSGEGSVFARRSSNRTTGDCRPPALCPPSGLRSDSDYWVPPGFAVCFRSRAIRAGALLRLRQQGGVASAMMCTGQQAAHQGHCARSTGKWACSTRITRIPSHDSEFPCLSEFEALPRAASGSPCRICQQTNLVPWHAAWLLQYVVSTSLLFF